MGATLNNVEFRSTLPSDDTFYAYDAAGNRIRERFTKGGVNYQDATIGYDALGRMTQVHDNTYTMRYDYDANGNRRRAQSSYYDENNVLKNVDNWYLYDGMNRITLSQGVLSAGTIQINNDQGVQLAYDAAGNRRTATTMESGVAVSESYSYDANNRLVSTARDGSTTSLRSYDLAGKVTEQSSFSSPGTLSERRTSSYDANGRVTEQNVYNGANTHTQRTQYTAYDGVGNNTSYQVQVLAGTAYTNYYTTSYAKFDGYKESQVAGSSTWFQAGATTSSYDRNGNLTAVSETFATSKNRSFVTDQAGSILRKTENGKTQNYFYAGDKPLGSSGALSGADFDFNYTPVSEQFPGTVPGNYVVSSGDTLRGIALSLFGDAQLWYLIADANGLKSDADLQVGKNLTVPNKVTNLRNAADTFKPYAPGRIIGDTRPTLPDPPPPPAQSSDDGGCGGVGAILVAVVAVVAVVMTAGAAAIAMAAPGTALAGSVGLTATWAAGVGALGMGAAGAASIGAAMIGGAVGSIASQAVGMALGVQEEFSWSGVAMGAIGAGVSAGLAGTFGGASAGAGGAIGRAVAGSVITQGIGVVTGMQKEFSWAGVAAAGVSAGVSYGVGQLLPEGFGTQPGTFDRFTRDFVTGLAGGAAGQIVSGGKANWGMVAADAFGNALGTSLGESLAGSGAQQLTKLSAAKTEAYLGGINPSASSAQGLKANGWTIGYDASPADDFTGVGRAPAGSWEAGPSTVRAGDYGGSLERIARAQLGPNASQRAINNYVGQLFEINGVTNARAIGPNREIILPTADTSAASEGLGLYGKDIAIGENLRASAALATAAASENQREMNRFVTMAAAGQQGLAASASGGMSPMMGEFDPNGMGAANYNTNGVGSAGLSGANLGAVIRGAAGVIGDMTYETAAMAADTTRIVGAVAKSGFTGQLDNVEMYSALGRSGMSTGEVFTGMVTGFITAPYNLGYNGTTAVMNSDAEGFGRSLAEAGLLFGGARAGGLNRVGVVVDDVGNVGAFGQRGASGIKFGVLESDVASSSEVSPSAGKYTRSMSERQTALLRDALDPDSGLSQGARDFILENNGKRVPKNYEVSHEEPLYTGKTYEAKKALDVADNMKTQPKDEHRARHKICGDQYHQYPR